MSASRYHSSSPSIGEVGRGRKNGQHMARTGVRVRRNSVDVADPQAKRYSLPFHEEEVAAYLQAAERYNLEHKEEGRYVGPFRGRGMDVLRWLLREAKANAGICCPSHAQIAEALKIGRRTVSRILKALFLSGFLEWQRRSKDVEAEEGGTRKEQTSSLYRFNLPTASARLVACLVAQRTKRQHGIIRGMRVVGAAELHLRPSLWDKLVGRAGHDGGLLGHLLSLARGVDRETASAKLAVS